MPPTEDVLLELLFPVGGISFLFEYELQPALTTARGFNVRGYEPISLRARGGARPGLSKYIPSQLPIGATVIQHLNILVDPDASALLGNFGPPAGTPTVPNPDFPTGWPVPLGGWGVQYWPFPGNDWRMVPVPPPVVPPPPPSPPPPPGTPNFWAGVLQSPAGGGYNVMTVDGFSEIGTNNPTGLSVPTPAWAIGVVINGTYYSAVAYFAGE